MTDVIEEIRHKDATPPRLRRVRCLHCLIPVGQTQPTCWSCGLDPTGPVDADGRGLPTVIAKNALPPPLHSALLVAAASVLVLVALLGTVVMLGPQEEGRGVRGLHARINGHSWARAEVRGATAEFPSRPVRSTVELGSAAGDALVATATGLRVELRGVSTTAHPSPAELLTAYGAAIGRQIRLATPAPVPGASAHDALLDGPHGVRRVRAVVSATSAYLLVVDGPAAAFERFTASFVPAP